MLEWLRETHGSHFELLRHFLRRFFESEMITSPEQTRSALIGGFSLMLPWFTVLFGPLKEKYAHLSALPVPGPYREALRTDELWLITMTMSIIGMLTAVKWQSLFPDLRDYRVLGSLPLRTREIFLAKFLALLVVAGACMIVISAMPAGAFPALAHGRWQTGSLSGSLALSVFAGSGFFLSGLVALQGVLLNLLRPRAFRVATGYLQGLLVGLMLSLTVLSFAIQPDFAAGLLRPEWARWLPPIWYLGLCQSRSGNSDPAMSALAHRGWMALLIAVLLALSTYVISYRRHRSLLVEGGGRPPQKGQSNILLGWLFRDPRQQGVVAFMLTTLGRSGHHRMVLMGYGGLAFAIAMTGAVTLKDPAVAFVFFHMVAIVVLLIGARHLFSRPTELKANWVFQLTERDARGEWLYAVDRLVLLCASLLWIVPLPVEVHWLGMRGIAEAALTAIGGLALYNWTFSSWDKLPFTCSYLPGKTEGWVLALRFLAIAAVMPFLQGLLFRTLYSSALYTVLFVILAAAWRRFHIARREHWPEVRLKYEEVLDPAVHGLNLGR